MNLVGKEESMAGKHDIYVLEADGEFRVRPAVAIVQGGKDKRLRIRNLTEYLAFLVFPNGPLDAAESQTQSVQAKGTVGQAGKVDRVTLSIDQNADGDYDYQVFVLKNGTAVPAKGESGPKIIVDP
jgi:hypothetical protein